MRYARHGFTLIELLIVIVIVGILAGIAIPKFAVTKERAYLAQMKADLRHLTDAEESYASDHLGTYIPAGTATAASPWQGVAATSGVTITIDVPGVSAYSATAVHSAAPGKVCGIYYNMVTPPGGSNPATAPGEPKCN